MLVFFGFFLDLRTDQIGTLCEQWFVKSSSCIIRDENYLFLASFVIIISFLFILDVWRQYSVIDFIGALNSWNFWHIRILGILSLCQILIGSAFILLLARRTDRLSDLISRLITLTSIRLPNFTPRFLHICPIKP